MRLQPTVWPQWVGGLWGAYVLGWIVNPYALLAGAVLAIGGTVVANLLTDSDAETIVKKGPFGRQFAEAGLLDSLMGQDQRFVHLKDPQTAYRQLLGVLGHPRVFVHRLEDWRKLRRRRIDLSCRKRNGVAKRSAALRYPASTPSCRRWRQTIGPWC